jgi:hypothetical protein
MDFSRVAVPQLCRRQPFRRHHLDDDFAPRLSQAAGHRCWFDYHLPTLDLTRFVKLSQVARVRKAKCVASDDHCHTPTR